MDFTFRPPSLSELNFSKSTEGAMRSDAGLARKLAGLARDLHAAREASREGVSDRLYYYTDRTEGYKMGTAEWMAPSRKALEDPETPAAVLLIAARNVLGPGMTAWEPDTLHVELEEREGLKVPAVNFDKLMAAITLLEVPAFYIEANTFENTVMAFNHMQSDPDVLHEASPAQMCWAVYEAELIRHENMLFDPDFDYEPRLYVAGALSRAGMVLAPSILDFAQDELDGLNVEKQVEPSKVKAMWDKVQKQDLGRTNMNEDPMGVQLHALAVCHLYLHEMADKYQKALAALKG